MSQITEQLMQLLKPIQNVLECVIAFLYENVTANYGLAIILLTIIVRIILLPLTISQTKSMTRMQMLQPELKEIQKQYKDDQQRMQQEIMAFYKKNNVNPLSGCLPLLLQMPIFFALFQLLRDLGVNAIGAGSQTLYKFLWLDLTIKDPYYILPILMVGTMILTSKMTQTDMTQTGMNSAMMTYMLPVVFGFISYNMQSGILVYWVTTNVWSIGQQWVVNKIISKNKVKQELEQKKKKLVEKDEISEEELKKIIKEKKKRKKRK